MARPSGFTPEQAAKATALFAAGKTDAEAAQELEVNPVTLHRWRKKYDSFCKTTKEVKAKADERVIKSLYERALGYSHEDVDIRVVEGKIVKTKLIKHYPPSEVACIFWLKNRQPDLWKDRTEQVHQNPDGTSLRSTLIIALGQAIAKGDVVVKPPDEPKAISQNSQSLDIVSTKQ